MQSPTCSSDEGVASIAISNGTCFSSVHGSYTLQSTALSQQPADAKLPLTPCPLTGSSDETVIAQTNYSSTDCTGVSTGPDTFYRSGICYSSIVFISINDAKSITTNAITDAPARHLGLPKYCYAEVILYADAYCNPRAKHWGWAVPSSTCNYPDTYSYRESRRTQNFSALGDYSFVVDCDSNKAYISYFTGKIWYVLMACPMLCFGCTPRRLPFLQSSSGPCEYYAWQLCSNDPCSVVKGSVHPTGWIFFPGAVSQLRQIRNTNVEVSTSYDIGEDCLLLSCRVGCNCRSVYSYRHPPLTHLSCWHHISSGAQETIKRARSRPSSSPSWRSSPIISLPRPRIQQ